MYVVEARKCFAMTASHNQLVGSICYTVGEPVLVFVDFPTPLGRANDQRGTRNTHREAKILQLK